MTADKRLERLKFRSWHRGTREMDLLLGSFADAHLPLFAPEELDRYETLACCKATPIFITGLQAKKPRRPNLIIM